MLSTGPACSRVELRGGTKTSTMWSGIVWATNSIGVFGPVCDDYFVEGPDDSWWITADDNNAATVVCRQLGYDRGEVLGEDEGSARFGDIDPATFSLDNVKCAGGEDCLSDCPHLTEDNCNAGEGAGLICYM